MAGRNEVEGYLKPYVSICMKTTLHIDDELLMLARQYTGIAEKTALVRMGLEALVERGAAMRLAKLKGADKRAKAGRRRSVAGK